MAFFEKLLTLAACLAMVWCQACNPSPPLTSKQSEETLEEDFPSHLVEAVLSEDPVPHDLVIPEETESETEPEPAGPPDWKARYQELNAQYRAAFVPPPAGKTVKLALATGQIREGLLVEVNSQGVKLGVEGGEVEIQRDLLAKQMRVRLFAEDYAHEKALRTVKLEKRNYDLAQQEQAREAELAEARAAARAKAAEAREVRTRVVLPVNDPRDGSVPAVVAYIEKNTRNPESIRYLKWWKVIPKDGKYIVRCQYQADGGDLGQLTLDKYFFLNASGRVYQTANYKGP